MRVFPSKAWEDAVRKMIAPRTLLVVRPEDLPATYSGETADAVFCDEAAGIDGAARGNISVKPTA